MLTRSWPNGLPARLERTLHRAVGVSLGDVTTLVDRLLAPRERDLDLRAAVLPVHAGRHQGQPPLADLPVERCDLAAVQEELAVTRRDMVGDVALLVGGDLGADEPHLSLADFRERLREGRAAVAQR